MVSKTLAVLCVCVGLTNAASFPSSYPFENEETDHVSSIAASRPDFSFTDGDPGGYFWIHAVSPDFTGPSEENFPYCTTLGGVDFIESPFMYAFVTLWKAPPVLSAENFNCSAKEIVFEATDFLGSVGGKDVGCGSDCCAYVHGKWMFSKDLSGPHKALGDTVQTFLCPEVPEESYCIMVGADFATNCLEYFLGPAERAVLHPCYDSHYLFFMSCPVFSSSPIVRYGVEPPQYMDSLTASEITALNSLTFGSDKVCNPYSYYHPAASGNSGNSDSDADTAESQAAHLLVVPIFAFLTVVF